MDRESDMDDDCMSLVCIGDSIKPCILLGLPAAMVSSLEGIFPALGPTEVMVPEEVEEMDSKSSLYRSAKLFSEANELEHKKWSKARLH